MKSGLQRVESEYVASIAELKRSPQSVMDSADGKPVAILNDDLIAAYIVPAEMYEAILESPDDLALASIIADRADEVPIPVALDDL